MLVCSLGDLTLDVVVRLAGPVAAGGDTDAEIRVAPGGQAANVAAWAAALGAQRAYVGKRGRRRSRDGSRARGLEARGVEVLGPRRGGTRHLLARLARRRAVDGGRPRSGGRACAPRSSTRRGSRLRPPLRLGLRAPRASPRAERRFRAAELARAQGAAVSVDLSTWSAIRDAGADEFRDAVLALGPDVVFANEDEAARSSAGRSRG